MMHMDLIMQFSCLPGKVKLDVFIPLNSSQSSVLLKHQPYSPRMTQKKIVQQQVNNMEDQYAFIVSKKVNHQSTFYQVY